MCSNFTFFWKKCMNLFSQNDLSRIFIVPKLLHFSCRAKGKLVSYCIFKKRTIHNYISCFYLMYKNVYKIWVFKVFLFKCILKIIKDILSGTINVFLQLKIIFDAVYIICKIITYVCLKLSVKNKCIPEIKSTIATSCITTIITFW